LKIHTPIFIDGLKTPTLNLPHNPTRRASNMSIYNPDDFYENYQTDVEPPEPDFYDDDQQQEHEEDDYNTDHDPDESEFSEEQLDEIEEEDPNFYFDDEDDGSVPDRNDD